MKITYYVGALEDLFRKHESKDTLYEADTLKFDDHYCFVYVDDVFVFSYQHDDMWLKHWARRPRNRRRDGMQRMFERWIRLKLRQLQRKPPSA